MIILFLAGFQFCLKHTEFCLNLMIIKLKDVLALIPNHAIDVSGVSKPSGYDTEPSYGYFRQKNIFLHTIDTLFFCPWTAILLLFFMDLFGEIT